MGYKIGTVPSTESPRQQVPTNPTLQWGLRPHKQV